MIDVAEYQSRRQALAAQLPANSVALIPAASEVLRNGDAHYRFRQDSDFYYLTGFDEPDALLVITANESLLFNRPRDPALELWTGPRLGQDEAPSQLGVDGAYALAELEVILPDLIAGRQAIYCPIGRYPLWDQCFQKAWQRVKASARRGVQAPEAFCDLAPVMGELRLIKRPVEIALMRQAASISVLAHQRALAAVRNLAFEHQLEAVLLQTFVDQGCRSPAYDSIVAGGSNACVLHYTNNDQPLKSGDLVLIDAAGEYRNYAADITRTFPINGRFSPEQRQIYDLVLGAQHAGLACVRPGTAWDEIQRVMVVHLTQGLVDLKILKGPVGALIEQEAYKAFYPHSSGHWLGLDVHDTGRYKIAGQWRRLEPGMVLTVEPGLYLSKGIKGLDPRWWGIGVRIEDDVLVTQEGQEVLTSGLVADAAAIEAMI